MDLWQQSQTIEPELEEEIVDLDFKVIAFELSKTALSPCDLVQSLFAEGWRINEEITCPPMVMLILHREKETNES